MTSPVPPVPPDLIPLTSYHEYPEREMLARARAFREDLQRRRTVRDFSSRAIPDGVLDECLTAAGTAPNGANMQPWHFVVVTDPTIKARIRVAAEEEEREFYGGRAPQEGLRAAAPPGPPAGKTVPGKGPGPVPAFRGAA